MIDPDCRDGKHESCFGGPCDCSCHVDEADARIVKRMDNVRDCTVSDLITWCVERDISPMDAYVTATHIKWESPETDVERERRKAWEVQKAESTERWERAQWEKLREKYGA